MEDKSKKSKERIISLSGLITGIVGTAVSVLVVILAVGTASVFPTSITKGIVDNQTKMIEIQDYTVKAIDEITDEIDSIKRQLSEITELSDKTKIAIELSKLKTDVDSIRGEHLKISEIIIKKPEDALSLILLEKDVENYRESTSASILTLDGRIQGNFNLMLVFIGGLVISLAGIYIRQIFEKKK